MCDSQFNPLKITGVTVTWEVENIWNLSFDGVASASFLLSDHIFHLFVRRYELSVAIYLCRDDAVPTVLSLLCNLCMIGQFGQEKLIGEKEILIEKGKEFVLVNSINIKDLERQKEKFLMNDTLVIKCNLSASYRKNLSKHAERENAVKSIKCFETLSSDFENFYIAQTGIDALLKVEETEFPVHRAVLCARSPVLASILAQDTSEQAIKIPDIQSSIFCEVLYYVYSGKVRELTPETAIPMLTAASRFSLHELKSICLKFIQSTLSDDNVFEIAVLAYETDDLFLKEEVEKYIVENLTSILPSEKWKEFCAERYKFANEILTTVLLRMNQNAGDNKES